MTVIAFSVAAVICTFLGGFFALRFKDHLHLILGFSAGAVLGAAFFDLMPHALELGGKQYDASVMLAVVALGFAAFMILDRLVDLHPHHDEGGYRGELGAGSLSFHSFLDGAAIGAAFQASASMGWIVGFAILAHKFSDGINIIGVTLKNKSTPQRAVRWLITASCAPVAGAVVTQFMKVSAADLGLILALFCGSFIYIGASDLVPESHHRHPTLWTTVSTLMGLAVLFFAIRLAGV